MLTKDEVRSIAVNVALATRPISQGVIYFRRLTSSTGGRSGQEDKKSKKAEKKKLVKRVAKELIKKAKKKAKKKRKLDTEIEYAEAENADIEKTEGADDSLV